MSKTVLRRIDCHEAEELALALEAEEARCQRGFAATQLLGLRLFGESAGSVCGHFASVAKACDRIFVLDKWSAVLLQPRQDEAAARRVGDNVLRFAGCPCALLLCSVPDSFLLAKGAGSVLSFFEKSLKKASPDASVQTISLPGSERSDEDAARVSVEEKNFLFSC